jgi:hypothetical protein
MRTSSSYALVVPSVLGGYLGNVRRVYKARRLGPGFVFQWSVNLGAVFLGLTAGVVESWS